MVKIFFREFSEEELESKVLRGKGVFVPQPDCKDLLEFSVEEP